MNHLIRALMNLVILAQPHLKVLAQDADPNVTARICWDMLAQKEKEYEVVNLKPLPEGATPGLMRVM